MNTIASLHEIIGGNIVGDMSQHSGFQHARSLDKADEQSLIWIKAGKSDIQEILDETQANTVILPNSVKAVPNDGQVFILVENPRLAFIKALQAFFEVKPAKGVHPSAYIHPEAKVHESASVGAFAYVGKSTIGEDTIIHSNVAIYDGITIGANVLIHSGTVIGADGFGFEKDDEGNVFKFPHVGGVLIEDNVEIGANTCVDRGVLDDTILRKGSKVDNLVHIAHNVEIGENSFVIANAMVAGSVKVGEGVWIAPSASIINGVSIGDKALVGMAALVTKSVPENEIWTGVPARPLSEFKSLQRKLRKL